jgi:hypothetical protein
VSQLAVPQALHLICDLPQGFQLVHHLQLQLVLMCLEAAAPGLPLVSVEWLGLQGFLQGCPSLQESQWVSCWVGWRCR